uniref:S23 ribosomal protein n=1 Tax=Heterorhabditis bacteriophora TaxID=37862 RepID=A0A1I7WW05_HETBA
MPKKTDRYRRIVDLAITRPAQELVLNCYIGHGISVCRHLVESELELLYISPVFLNI